MGSTQRQRGYNPQNRNRGRGRGFVGGRGYVWCPGEERGRGRCVTSEEVRLDRPASELADCVAQAPCLARGAALLERGGPLRSHFPLQVRPRAVQHRALAVRLLLAGG